MTLLEPFSVYFAQLFCSVAVVIAITSEAIVSKNSDTTSQKTSSSPT